MEIRIRLTQREIKEAIVAWARNIGYEAKPEGVILYYDPPTGNPTDPGAGCTASASVTTGTKS